jgi:capsular polysaccharide biosynthesis protein
MASSRFSLQLKVAGHAVLRIAKRWIGRSLRSLPGLPSLLNISSGKIRSTKVWVSERENCGDSSPLYLTVFPKMSIEPVEPKRPGSNLKLEPPPPRSDGKHYNYWDIRSGFDARQGFYRKPVEVFDEVFLAEIPDGRVLGPSGAILTHDLQLFTESIWTWDNWLVDDRTQTALHLPEPTRMDSPIYVAVSNQSAGFPHWLTETLPRLYGLSLLPPHVLPTIIFPSPLKTWQQDSIDLLGLDRYPILDLGEGYITSPKLFFPSYVGRPGTPHPLACQWIRETMLKRVEIPGRRSRIYISRCKANRRRIVNEDEILPILEEFGFETVIAENLSLAEQVSLFSTAEAVVTVHGAGLTNLLFVPRGCKVLEIMERTHMSDYFYNLASAAELDYHYDICRPLPSSEKLPQGYADIEVEPRSLRFDLEVLFAN